VTTSPLSGSVFEVGATTVNVTATDAQGNTATSSFTVTVLYNFFGFLLTVDKNAAKAGSVIPVAFSLSGNKGLNILLASLGKTFPFVRRFIRSICAAPFRGLQQATC
jgi:hypothetical protein